MTHSISQQSLILSTCSSREWELLAWVDCRSSTCLSPCLLLRCTLLVSCCYWCSMLQLGRPAKYEQLRTILRKYFANTDDAICYALHGDDVCCVLLLASLSRLFLCSLTCWIVDRCLLYSFNLLFLSIFLCLGFYFLLLSKRLAEKSISKMTYFVSIWTSKLLNQVWAFNITVCFSVCSCFDTFPYFRKNHFALSPSWRQSGECVD